MLKSENVVVSVNDIIEKSEPSPIKKSCTIQTFTLAEIVPAD